MGYSNTKTTANRLNYASVTEQKVSKQLKTNNTAAGSLITRYFKS